MAHQIEGFVSNQSILISDNLFYAGNLFIEMMMYTAKLNTFMTRGSKIQSPLQLRDYFITIYWVSEISCRRPFFVTAAKYHFFSFSAAKY